MKKTSSLILTVFSLILITLFGFSNLAKADDGPNAGCEKYPNGCKLIYTKITILPGDYNLVFLRHYQRYQSANGLTEIYENYDLNRLENDKDYYKMVQKGWDPEGLIAVDKQYFEQQNENIESLFATGTPYNRKGVPTDSGFVTDPNTNFVFNPLNLINPDKVYKLSFIVQDAGDCYQPYANKSPSLGSDECKKGQIKEGIASFPSEELPAISPISKKEFQYKPLGFVCNSNNGKNCKLVFYRFNEITYLDNGTKTEVNLDAPKIDGLKTTLSSFKTVQTQSVQTENKSVTQEVKKISVWEHVMNFFKSIFPWFNKPVKTEVIQVATTTNNQIATTTTAVAFSATGNLVKNNPGLKPNIWYLVYEKPGAPALNVELYFGATNSFSLFVGERVSIEGILRGSAVTVSKLTPILSGADIKNQPESQIGIVKNIYQKGDESGPYYIDIDYIEWISDKKTCDTRYPSDLFSNGYCIINDNPLIRTFEIDPNALVSTFYGIVDNKFKLGSVGGSTDVKTFMSAFNNPNMLRDDDSIAVNNPHKLFNIKISGGKIVEMSEQYQP